MKNFFKGVAFGNKYLAALIITLSFFSASQGQVYQKQSIYGVKYPRLAIDSALLIPTGNGVPLSLKSITTLKHGAVYVDSTNHRMYFYDPSNSTWYQTATGSAVTDTTLIRTIVHDSLSVKDTTVTNFPVYVIKKSTPSGHDTLAFRGDSLQMLKYATPGRNTGTWTARTLVDKGYADSLAALSGAGSVISFGKVDGYGISSSVSNPTTTPVHTVAVDTTVVASQTRLTGNVNDLTTLINTKGSGTVTSFSKTDGYGVISSVANSTTTPNHTVRVDTSVIESVINANATTANLVARIGTNTTNITTNTASLLLKLDSVKSISGNNVDTLSQYKNGIRTFVDYIDHIGGIVSGGIVTYSGSGLTFNITSGIAWINDVRVVFPAQSVTLSAADATFSTIYVFYVDNAGTFGFIRGTPGTNPLDPSSQVDAASQLYRGFELIGPGATTPTVTSVTQYDTNTGEWTGTSAGGATVNFGGLTNPFNETHSTDIGAFTNGQTITYTKPSGTVTGSSFNTEKFYVRLKAAFASTANILVTFLNAGVAVSNTVTVTAAYGFNKATIGSYQNITIPLSAFTFTNNNINAIRFTLQGTNASGLYLDYVQLLQGTSSISNSGLQSVTGTLPISVTAGNTPNVSIDTTTVSGVASRVRLAGDSAVLATAIAAKQTQLSGTGYVKFSGVSPSYLTPTQVTADLNLFTISLQGLVPPGGSSAKVLHGDGVWRDTTAGGSSLPAQTGKVNNYLKTNGISATWSRLNFNAPTYWELFGDSYTLGLGATLPSTDGFAFLLAGLYNKTYNNRALSGAGIYAAARNHYAYVNPLASIISTATINSSMSIVTIGLYDFNRSGANSKTTAKFLNGMKAIITNQFLKNVSDAGTGSGVTRTGTWNAAYNNVTQGGGKFTTAASTATNGSYIEYAFIGNNVAIGLQGGDGTNAIRATLSISIDGVSQGSFTENSQSDAIYDASNALNNWRSPMALNFLNLTDSNHIIRLTNTSTDTLVVDYFGVLKDPAFCHPLLINEIPYLNTYASGSNAVTLQANNSLDSLIGLYPNYPIVIGKTNSYLNSYNIDGITPSTKGHRQLYQADYLALDSLLTPEVNQLLYSNTGTNNMLGSLRVQGSLSGYNPLPLANPAIEMSINGTPIGLIQAANRSNGTNFPLGITASTITLNSTFEMFTTANTVVGALVDVPSSRFTVNHYPGLMVEGSIPAPRMHTNLRDSITSSILNHTKATSGSGYSGSGANIALTCVTCANPLAAGAVAAGINVVSGAVTSVSAQINGTNYTVGDTLTAAFNGGTGYKTVVTVLNTGVKGLQVYDSSVSQVSKYNGTNWDGSVTITGAATYALKFGNDYIFTGSTSTFTLPANATNITGRQNGIMIKNRGSGTITLNTASGSTLYSTSAVSTINIAAGAACFLLPDGTYFNVQYNL